jgi:hypothetical protein
MPVMSEWLNTRWRVRPSILCIAASELLFCIPLRHKVNTCDGSVFLLPIFAGVVGLVCYQLAAKLSSRSAVHASE